MFNVERPEEAAGLSLEGSIAVGSRQALGKEDLGRGVENIIGSLHKFCVKLQPYH